MLYFSSILSSLHQHNALSSNARCRKFCSLNTFSVLQRVVLLLTGPSCPIQFPDSNFQHRSQKREKIKVLGLLAWFCLFSPPPNARLGKGWVIIQALLSGFIFVKNSHFGHYQLGPDWGMLQRKKKNQKSFSNLWIIHQHLSVAKTGKNSWKSIDHSSSFLLSVRHHVQIFNVPTWNKGSIKQKRCFKAVIALCWTPVTPTGKQRSYETFFSTCSSIDLCTCP